MFTLRNENFNISLKTNNTVEPLFCYTTKVAFGIMKLFAAQNKLKRDFMKNLQSNEGWMCPLYPLYPLYPPVLNITKITESVHSGIAFNISVKFYLIRTKTELILVRLYQASSSIIQVLSRPPTKL